jgi:hypothetical protein
MREFEAAIGRAAMKNDQEITVLIKGGEELGNHELTVKPPTTGQLALFINRGAGRSGRGIGAVTGILEFFSDITDEDNWQMLKDLLRDGLDIGVLAEISTYLIGEWSGRPTRSPSEPSPTRRTTGRKSTAKRQAAVARTS